MSKENWSNILSVLARTALAVVFVFGQTAQAVQGQNAKDKPASSTEPKSQQTKANVRTATPAKAQSAEEGTETQAAENHSSQENADRDGQHEGIKVHGHWTIEVRNPDGTLVTHREFENSYSGGAYFATILSRSGSVGFWQINLSGNICQPGGIGCLVAEPNYPLETGPNIFRNLAISLFTNPNSIPNSTLILSGNATASFSGSIQAVDTENVVCAPMQASGVCPEAPGQFVFTVTSATLPTPITISANQVVQVTVAISFS